MAKLNPSSQPLFLLVVPVQQQKELLSHLPTIFTTGMNYACPDSY